MPNFTWSVENCKIFKFDGKPDGSKSWGLLAWTDGTIDFEQKFETSYRNVIEIIEANRGSTAEFKVSGYLTKNAGYGEHKGKFFNNYIVDKIEIAGMDKMSPKELVEKVFNVEVPEEIDEEIPF